MYLHAWYVYAFCLVYISQYVHMYCNAYMGLLHSLYQGTYQHFANKEQFMSQFLEKLKIYGGNPILAVFV